MESYKRRVAGGAAGAAAGLLGLAGLIRCPGTTCTSCLGCLGAAAGLLLAVPVRRWLSSGQCGPRLPADAPRGYRPDSQYHLQKGPEEGGRLKDD